MACFGGGGSTQTSKIPGQEELWKKLSAVYEGEIGAGQPIYGGEWIAPFSAQQQTALGTIGQYKESFAPSSELPLFGTTGETLARTLRGEGGAAPITPEETEAFYKSAYEKPALYAFEQYERPTIRESYAGPGYWSSARAGAESKAAQDLWQNLGTQRGNLEWNVLGANRAAQEAAAQRALGAAGPAMAYAGLPTQEALARLGGAAGVYQALTPEQAQRQAQITTEMEKFAAQQRITDPEDLAILMALLNVSFGQGSSAGPGLGYAALSSFMGGAGAGAGAAAGAKFFPIPA